MGKKKGGKKGGSKKGGSKKGGSKSTKAKNIGGPAVVLWDLYKVGTSQNFAGTGKSAGRVAMEAPFSEPARAAINGAIKSGEVKQLAIEQTKEAQVYALIKVAEGVPVIKEFVRPLTRTADRAMRQLTKGKYVIFGGR